MIFTLLLLFTIIGSADNTQMKSERLLSGECEDSSLWIFLNLARRI